jgi:hypothetical protein
MERRPASALRRAWGLVQAVICAASATGSTGTSFLSARPNSGNRIVRPPLVCSSPIRNPGVLRSATATAVHLLELVRAHVENLREPESFPPLACVVGKRCLANLMLLTQNLRGVIWGARRHGCFGVWKKTTRWWNHTSGRFVGLARNRLGLHRRTTAGLHGRCVPLVWL